MILEALCRWLFCMSPLYLWCLWTFVPFPFQSERVSEWVLLGTSTLLPPGYVLSSHLSCLGELLTVTAIRLCNEECDPCCGLPRAGRTRHGLCAMSLEWFADTLWHSKHSWRRGGTTRRPGLLMHTMNIQFSAPPSARISRQSHHETVLWPAA